MDPNPLKSSVLGALARGSAKGSFNLPGPNVGGSGGFMFRLPDELLLDYEKNKRQDTNLRCIQEHLEHPWLDVKYQQANDPAYDIHRERNSSI